MQLMVEFHGSCNIINETKENIHGFFHVKRFMFVVVQQFDIYLTFPDCV